VELDNELTDNQWAAGESALNTDYKLVMRWMSRMETVKWSLEQSKEVVLRKMLVLLIR
jgi:hypothetical protein